MSLKGEAARSEDMFSHIEEILISVRLAFLNCFLDFAGKPSTPNFHDCTCITDSQTFMWAAKLKHRRWLC